ncbi:hypothetical protein K7X08_012797 [Anisodus acutangulus]|uniref:catechol oxidase n=1 Tax=Anisodus acutangulus TaxID=402998 RepID=A0A9Q1MAN7_9SOLA|nr:hypothetical protein K7X08_012797 [Anisodus acutangulus]
MENAVLTNVFKVSCMGGHEANLDRRNVILGLGGIYGAANLVPLASSAEELSGPIPAPNLKKCGTALITAKAAHTVDEEYIAKYQQATSAMKALDIYDPSNPIGFKQQANIHCAYCNNAYTVGAKKLQVHESWLFFPFHRWYLYFYERILGSLINDSTFALPYWNWDNPNGMRLPPMYDDKCSSLYDARRNPNIRNGTIMDLGYFPPDDEVLFVTSQPQTITNNLTLMYRQMITNAPCPLDFLGKRYTLGTGPLGPKAQEPLKTYLINE